MALNQRAAANWTTLQEPVEMQAVSRSLWKTLSCNTGYEN